MNIKRQLTSCFGLGFSPIASGTFGSLPPVILFAVLTLSVSNTVVTALALLATGLLFAFATVRFTPYITSLAGSNDPSEIVSDEYAGQAVTILIAMSAFNFNTYPLTTAVCCFVLFRLFDIVKPYPVCAAEKLPAGWGVLLDDIAAGIYAGVCYLLFQALGWVDWIDNFLFSGANLNVGYAVFLGAVQGLTEFLPVSSSGHLVFFEHFMPNLDPDTPQMLLFDLSIHLATLVAIISIYIHDIKSFTVSIFDVKKHNYRPIAIYKHNPAWRFAVCAAVSTIVTVLLYKTFEGHFKSARQLPVVVTMWFVTGTFLMITDRKKTTRMGLRDFGIMAAVIIGIAQATAILPGISRSGATICAAILLGLKRKWAVQYSFLIAIPAILGGTILEFLDNPGILGSSDLPLLPIAAGMLTACAVGIAALKLLIYVSQKKKLKVFAIYLYSIATISLIYMMLN